MKVLPRRGQEENLNLQEDKAEGVQQPLVVILARLVLSQFESLGIFESLGKSPAAKKPATHWICGGLTIPIGRETYPAATLSRRGEGASHNARPRQRVHQRLESADETVDSARAFGRNGLPA